MLTNHIHSSCPDYLSQEILKLVSCQLKNASSFFWKCYQAESGCLGGRLTTSRIKYSEILKNKS